MTNAGVLATGTDPSFGGTLCRVACPGGGGPTYYGGIAVGAAPVNAAAATGPYVCAGRAEARSTASRRCALPRAACCRVPVFDFADGGAEDERTLRRNEQAFDDVALLPRPLNGAAARDLSHHAVRQRRCRCRSASRRPGWPGCSGRTANARRRAPRPPPAPSTAPATARPARWRTSPRPAQRRAGCRCSSTGTAASPARWSSGRRPRATTRWC